MKLVVADRLHIGQPQFLLVDAELHQGVVLGDAVILAVTPSGTDEFQRIGPVVLVPPKPGILAVGQIVEVVIDQFQLLLIRGARSGREQA
ncbi:hypothetical protein D3C86_1052080 [compost metagenome]